MVIYKTKLKEYPNFKSKIKLPVERRHCWGDWPVFGQNALANHWNAAAAVWLPRACHGLKSKHFLTDWMGKKISLMFNEYIYNNIPISVLKIAKFYWFICLFCKTMVNKRKNSIVQWSSKCGPASVSTANC